MKFSLAGRIQTLGIEAVFDNVEASAWAVRPFAHKTTRCFCFCPGFSSWEKRRSDGSEAASSSSVLSSCSLSLSLLFPGKRRLHTGSGDSPPQSFVRCCTAKEAVLGGRVTSIRSSRGIKSAEGEEELALESKAIPRTI